MLENIVTTILDWYWAHLNYWVITILMILENSIVPLPAEMIVTPAAYKAAQGDMNVYILILCTTFGSTIGALINYYLSRRLGRYLIYRLVDSKFGRLFMLDKGKLEKAERLFLKYGNISTFFGRLLPFGRQLISIPAGLARMPIGAFVLYTAIGSTIWNSLLVGTGYCLAEIMPQEEFTENIGRYAREASIVFFVLFAAYIIYYCIKRRINRNRS